MKILWFSKYSSYLSILWVKSEKLYWILNRKFIFSFVSARTENPFPQFSLFKISDFFHNFFLLTFPSMSNDKDKRRIGKIKKINRIRSLKRVTFTIWEKDLIVHNKSYCCVVERTVWNRNKNNNTKVLFSGVTNFVEGSCIVLELLK